MLFTAGDYRKFRLTPAEGGRGFLPRLVPAWRKAADWLIPVLVALAAIALNQAGLFRVLDGMAFDFITTHESTSPPRVMIIDPDPAFEQRGDGRHTELARGALALGIARVVFLVDPKVPDLAAELPANRIIVGQRIKRVPGSSSWKLVSTPASETRALRAASVTAAPEYGIHRLQLAGLKGISKPVPTLETAAVAGDPDALPYYIRMPRGQNVPRITASQLLDGQIAAREVKGLIALVSPDSQEPRRSYATPLNTGGRAMPEEEFRALAIQTLADGHPVRPTPLWLTALLVLGLCLAATALYRRFDPKRIIVPATAAITVVLVGAIYLVLQFADILLPASSLLFSQGLLAALIIHRSETGQDRLLSRQVDRAISVAFRRGSFDNQSRLPNFLLDSARVLDVKHMLLLERRADGEIVELGSIRASLTDLEGNRQEQSQFFDEARRSLRTCESSGLVRGWEGPVWMAWLGGAERDLYWLYTFAGANKRRRGERLAAAMIGSYRELQNMRASLSAGEGRRWSFQSIDDKVTSALDLITGHDEQIRNGLDALDTSVMVFHLLGYPLHANAAMVRLLEAAEISLVDTTLQEAIVQLSLLEPERIAKMLHELLFRGGELRVPCRPLGARTVVLRISAPFRVAKGSERVIMLEAIDITNLKRLADLRLSVSNFIDSQLRNDLEAITLGASIAGENAGPSSRVINLIAKAAGRAMNSLEEVAVHLSNPTDDVLGLAYPVDASEIARRAAAKTEAFASDLQVSITTETPGIGGYTIAEPVALQAMLEAMLMITIAETQPGDAVELKVEEERDHTRIGVKGGFGISFESLCAALDSPEAGAPPEYRAITSGIRQALGWNAKLSYWSEIGKGYMFNIELRRIG
jgi:CHASE2 domain-containing sensor protein